MIAELAAQLQRFQLFLAIIHRAAILLRARAL